MLVQVQGTATRVLLVLVMLAAAISPTFAGGGADARSLPVSQPVAESHSLLPMYPGECFANTFFLVGGAAVFVATTSSNPPGWVVLMTIGGTVFQTISTANACSGGPSASICIRHMWGMPSVMWEHTNYDPYTGGCGGGGGGGGSW